MLTLVHAPRSRSSRFLWLLEEIGEPYDIQYVSIRRVDGSGALDPTTPHPHGKVPFLKDHASTVSEQTAIALYLADKFPEAHLGPAIGDPARGAFLTALAYYSGVLEPAFDTDRDCSQRVHRSRRTGSTIDAPLESDVLVADSGLHGDNLRQTLASHGCCSRGAPSGR